MLLSAVSHLRSLQSLNSGKTGSESGSFYGPIFFFAVTLVILLIAYLGSRESKSKDPK